MQMSVFVLNGLLTDEQYKLWLKLVDLDTMFATKVNYSKEELEKDLPQKIYKFKKTLFRVSQRRQRIC